MNHFHSQFERENQARIRRGLEPHADVIAYLRAQGYTEAEARARAGHTAGGTSEASSDAPPDVAGIYATANMQHRASIYGAGDPAVNSDALKHGDPMESGRLAGVDSPAAFVQHLEQADQDDRAKDRKAESDDEASAEDRRAFMELGEALYAGQVNQRYREAIGDAKASGQ